MSNFKNPFVEKKSVPLPRCRGNAIERPNGMWSWEFDIFIGEEYMASMSYPPDGPGFLAKETAIEDMRTHAEETGKLLAKEVYGVEDINGFYDLTKNQFYST